MLQLETNLLSWDISQATLRTLNGKLYTCSKVSLNKKIMTADVLYLTRLYPHVNTGNSVQTEHFKLVLVTYKRKINRKTELAALIVDA